MSRITVIGGTGYAGSAIVEEAAARGHEVTAYSRSLPDPQIPGVTYVQGDASHEPALASLIEGADVVVGALSPRGALADTFRDVYRTIARLADTAKVPLFIVGRYSSLRPEPGAPRYVTDLSHAPAEYHAELTTVAALVADDLPATPATLDWVFVSPAGNFGSYVPGERLGHYRVGGDVALQPKDGGEISGADYALGFVDVIEQGNHHRAHINLGY
ncbi:NAD-dependent dehydratase [Arthrobacter livingstonensis]|uniref:NAD-dependent dehydratase n=1 Tax=Arthrobacter livingstonensis TaxID=670078 RepID=A0A2V5L446_9MICC|nr:NAD(P)H-binding protein [Arthrobacter livingstonensis]PYI64904.1 NAD-dependent dehydratase [Arthrobacter livingstonensis]